MQGSIPEVAPLLFLLSLFFIRREIYQHRNDLFVSNFTQCNHSTLPHIFVLFLVKSNLLQWLNAVSMSSLFA
jgi:hypothetical protein